MLFELFNAREIWCRYLSASRSIINTSFIMKPLNRTVKLQIMCCLVLFLLSGWVFSWIIGLLEKHTRHIYCKFLLPWKIEPTSSLTFGIVYCFFLSFFLVSLFPRASLRSLENHVYMLLLLSSMLQSIYFFYFLFLVLLHRKQAHRLRDCLIWLSCGRSFNVERAREKARTGVEFPFNGLLCSLMLYHM